MENDPPGSLLNIIYNPHPVAGASPETLDEYITGPDPETGKPVIEEIIDFLTKPQSLKKPAKEAVSSQSGKPVLLGPDTEENLQDLFYENGWTDGNPLSTNQGTGRKMRTGTCADPDSGCQVFV